MIELLGMSFKKSLINFFQDLTFCFIPRQTTDEKRRVPSGVHVHFSQLSFGDMKYKGEGCEKSLMVKLVRRGWYSTRLWVLVGCVSISCVTFAASDAELNTAQTQQPIDVAQQAAVQADDPAADTGLSTESKRQDGTDQQLAQILNATAFGNAVQAALPLSPQQIIRLRQLFNQSQVASTTAASTPPRPVIASRNINLSPGSTPMVIRLAQGYVSTLAFLDSTGQPWPIESYNIGDPQTFNMQWDKKGNLLMIQSTTLYNTGNLVVQLRELSTPVILTLISGQQAVDYRLDLRVQGMGPYAKPILGRSLPAHVGFELLEILDGISLPNSVALSVTGGAAQAWLLGDRLFVRTRLSLLSPAWVATVSSSDGMRAYELPKTPLILGTANGQTIHLKIQGL